MYISPIITVQSVGFNRIRIIGLCIMIKMHKHTFNHRNKQSPVLTMTNGLLLENETESNRYSKLGKKLFIDFVTIYRYLKQID